MTEPVSDARAKAHLRVSDDDPYVSVLASYIVAARMAVEQYLNATIANRARTLTLDKFPDDGVIILPNGPVISVTSIAYLDADGTARTVAADGWVLVNYPLADTLTAAFGTAWPVTRDQPGTVTVTYSAGMMGGSPLSLDGEDIIAGILLTLGDLWENREAQFVGVVGTANKATERLLHFYRRDLGV